LTIGPRAVKSGKSTVLFAWDGGFSAFEVTPEQAKMMNVPDKDLGLQVFGYPAQQFRLPRPFTLSALKIDNADNLDPAKKITGAVTCERLEDDGGTLALRWTQFGTGGLSMADFALFDGVGKGETTLKFTFPDLSMLRNKMAGTSVAVVELVSYPSGTVSQGVATVPSNPVLVPLNVPMPTAEKK
jgi:hypothetical protein